jgi:trans-aconitate methyltransferase
MEQGMEAMDKPIMTNPWLRIPASDYEGHMSSPKVAQQSFLARTFKESLESHNSSKIALLGCATGNGLEHVNRDVTRRVTAIDINPEYLDMLRQRYEVSVPGLEIVEADLETCSIENQTFSLIFAGLIFEYLDPLILLSRIAGWLRSDGVMVTVLQLPANHLKKITDTSYVSLKKLDSIMKFISPHDFKSMAAVMGLQEREPKTVTLESGKSFYIGTYAK